MLTNKHSLTFHINNLSYTVNLDDSDSSAELEKELRKNLPENKNIDTKTLFMLYVQQINEFLAYKNEINKIVEKISENV